jgi:acyl-CoA reductase-like NAD-dependent aldehyde dehydrogenase
MLRAGRLLVQQGIADKLVRKLQEAVQKIRVGDPLTCEDPCMGPLISQAQYQKVLHYVQAGLQGTCPSPSLSQSLMWGLLRRDGFLMRYRPT